MIAAIVLAAGTSDRMGKPKAALAFRGTTFLGAILDAARALGLTKRVVVVGPDANNLLGINDLSDVDVIRNNDLATGPIGSIRLAIRELLNHPVEGLLVWHVDRPHISLATIQALLDRFRVGDAAIVIPTYKGRRGHPVIFSRVVFDELLRAPASEGARRVVRADPARVAEVPVSDRAVLEDINSPQAYQELVRQSDSPG